MSEKNGFFLTLEQVLECLEIRRTSSVWDLVEKKSLPEPRLWNDDYYFPRGAVCQLVKERAGIRGHPVKDVPPGIVIGKAVVFADDDD